MAKNLKRTWKLQEFQGHESTINCLAFGRKANSHLIVSGSDDKKVNLWGIGKKGCLLSLEGHNSPIESVRFSPSDDLTLSGALSGAIKIWHLESKKAIMTISGHKSSVRSLDFHPYGNFIASGSLDTNIKLWDMRTKGCIYSYKGHTDCVNCLRFSPDGRWLVSASNDSCLKLWDLQAGKLLCSMSDHVGPVHTAEFHPNDLFLASAGADKTVKFWDLETMKLVSSSDGDSSAIRSILFHPNGCCLYAACHDYLKVYGWEPSRTLDSVAMSWGKAQDIVIAQNQLFGVSFNMANIMVYVAEIQKIQPLGGPPYPSSGAPNISQSNSQPSKRNSFLGNKPSFQLLNNNDTSEPKFAQEDVSTPTGTFESIDFDEYKKIFNPKKEITRELEESNFKPFLAPLDDGRISSSNSSHSLSQVSTREAFPCPSPTASLPSISRKLPATSRTTPKPKNFATRPDVPAGPSDPIIKNPLGRPSSEDRLARKKTDDWGGSKNSEKIISTKNDDYIPKSTTLSEEDVIISIRKAHDVSMATLNKRYTELQVVKTMWSNGNIKNALDRAMSDQAVLNDVINMALQNTSGWTLDTCFQVLPLLLNLVTSKYDNHVKTGMSGVKAVLQGFVAIIRENISGFNNIGVDITREERYNKCLQCQKHLMNIRMELGQKFYNSRDSLYKEIEILMLQLD